MQLNYSEKKIWKPSTSYQYKKKHYSLQFAFLFLN